MWNVSRILILVGLFATAAVWAGGSVGPTPVEIENFYRIAPGIYRGTSPVDADLETLRDLGFKTIINLRSTDRNIFPLVEKAKAYGIQVISHRMNVYLPPTDHEAREILNDMTNPDLQPVFLHCRFGLDRTGYITGLYRVLVEGWPAADAYAEMKSQGFNAARLPFYYRAYKKRFLDHSDTIPYSIGE